MSTSDTLEVYAPPLWKQFSPGAILQTDELPVRIPYWASLRAVGAYLDERHAHNVNVLENERGFNVRYAREEHQIADEFADLQHTHLGSLTYEQDRKKRRRGFTFGRSHEERAGYYENRLRAIGHELDSVGAYSIRLEELEEGWLLTYQYLRPTEGFNARKRMVILGIQEIQSILDDAVERRDRRKRGILTMLAS